MNNFDIYYNSLKNNELSVFHSFVNIDKWIDKILTALSTVMPYCLIDIDFVFIHEIAMKGVSNASDV